MSAVKHPSGQLPGSPPEGQCPACGAAALEPLYEQEAPVHTSVLLPTRERAVAYPRGTVRLELCVRCGFLTNSAFDAPGHDYSASYEETQAFSGRFREYSDHLVAALVERFDLVGRDVFEIGCGQADFLRRLCVATGGRGVGVDPSWREEHRAGEAEDQLEVRRAFFEPGQVDRPFGLAACRHTLEHIHDVSTFLGALADGLARHNSATPIYVEVPDTVRILRENAFWDIFYEHCSYFTPGSIARAFRHAGFRPVDVGVAFDDQYVQLIAVLGNQSATELSGEDSPDEIIGLSRRFAENVTEARDRWRSELGDAHAAGQVVVIWGAGSKGVGFLATLGLDDEISWAVDVNPNKHGMFMPGTGHEIIAPERLPEIAPDWVIVLNPAYADEITADIGGMGLRPKVSVL